MDREGPGVTCGLGQGVPMAVRGEKNAVAGKREVRAVDFVQLWCGARLRRGEVS